MGNYWYDHTEPDKDNDGIVDIPYVIATTLDVQILDKYPLTKPIHLATYETKTTTYTATPVTNTQTTTNTQLTTPETSVQETQTSLKEEGFPVMITIVISALLLALGVITLLIRKSPSHF